ncbi:MAG: hypothetical protein BGO49_24560 [Planctomycetales bacterium 71-10]|nr:MAG: hypothetical protein BGO49_24560 [Planctomycetales bacterium 71-10]
MTEILLPKEVAELLKIRPDTLRVWRKNGLGPPWFPLNESRRPKIRYRKEDVLRYIDQMTNHH